MATGVLMIKQKIVTNLWFDTEALEAAEFYCSIFPNSRIVDKLYYNDANPDRVGTVLTVNFELDGQLFTAINGGPEFKFDEAISLLVNCETQSEIDYYWDALTKDGEEVVCGWLKDKFGLSWQISPIQLEVLLKETDKEGVKRVSECMYGMKKLIINELLDAYQNENL
jgi:predicted 3-demethylubiquinone-9 3-methyltransferase (glyoxalase superfamily)